MMNTLSPIKLIFLASYYICWFWFLKKCKNFTINNHVAGHMIMYCEILILSFEF